MKRYTLLVLIFLYLCLGIMFNACTSSREVTKEPKEVFFKPISVVKPQPSDSCALKCVPRLKQREAAQVVKSESKNAIVDMIRKQNERIDEVVHQMNMIAIRQDVQAMEQSQKPSQAADSLNILLTQRDRVSNDLLLEMIKEQNQRLNEVIDQLKILAANQIQPQKQYYVEHVEAQPLTIPQPKSLIPTYTYEKAIQMYQSKQYERALRAFKSLLAEGIKASLADNCCFWIGVCHFNLWRMNQAIGAFKDVMSYPSSDKVEGAYFMLGQCYEQVGQRQIAINTYQKLLRMYPHTELRPAAERKLASLK